MSEIKYLDALAEALEILPGVGKKTAQRYAYYIAEKASEEQVEVLSSELLRIKKEIKHCSVCGMLCFHDVCDICSSNMRDKKKIMVLKDTKDILAVENTNEYNGLYHSINGLISPLDGVGPDEINIDSLFKRIDPSFEVILATPFTPQGETTALYLEKLLKARNIPSTRLGYGLPAGGDIEYVDAITLKRAIENRK